MAALARLSPYHFGRQFKAATGLPPHQYVLAGRVERAQKLLQADGDLSLTEIAACAGPVPDVRKNHLTARKPRQDTGERPP